MFKERLMAKKLFSFFIFITLVMFLSGCIITARGTMQSSGRSNSNNDRNDNDMDIELVVIPGTYVYWFEADNSDVYFYRGMWWKSSGNSWYRASLHSGPWVVIGIQVVPQPVKSLPRNWKSKRNDAPHVHWSDTRQQWQRWENDKHWDRNKWKR
jgi:hypothetical protein